MAEVLLELPADERDAFKQPLGPVFTDAETLLASAGRPLVAVGDVVTDHLRRAGRTPHVALVDGRTERSPVDDEVSERLGDPDRTVGNPPATLTRELLVALVDALEAEGPTVLFVDGEEDLATVPVVLAAPEGTSVVYGQPGEGMVHARVGPETRAEARELFDLLAGDHDAALTALGLS